MCVFWMLWQELSVVKAELEFIKKEANDAQQWKAEAHDPVSIAIWRHSTSLEPQVSELKSLHMGQASPGWENSCDRHYFWMKKIGMLPQRWLLFLVTMQGTVNNATSRSSYVEWVHSCVDWL